MDVEIRHLKLIDAIVTEGGITRAAERLHVTQPALSHQLKEIEDRLSAPLFLRVKRKMILTEAGEKLLALARRILPEVESAEQNIRKLGTGEQGTLRISTECNTCYHWLPNLLISMQKHFPGVDVQIVLEATYHPLQALLAGKLDLAIAHSRSDEGMFSYFPLFQDELLILMRPDNPLASRSYLRPRDISDQNLIVYATPGEESLIFRKFLRPAGVAPKKVYKVALTEAILEMVKAGIGMSLVARWAAESYLKSRQLIGIPLTKKGVRRNWSAVILKTNSVPPFYSAFAKLLSDSALLLRSPGRVKLAI